MNQTRYCSTCGALLMQSAVICGECGARYQDSPYERRATDAPGAWAQAPIARSRDERSPQESDDQEEGIELISRESLEPREPGATTLRSAGEDQYDRAMVTQPGMQQGGPGGDIPGTSYGSGPSAPQQGSSAPAAQLEMPLDGCVPATPVKRLLAAVIDAVITTVVIVPLIIGTILLVTDNGSLLAQILIGIGAALPAAYAIAMIVLQGLKGFTLGKLILGMRTTSVQEAGTIGLLRALGRAVVYGVLPPLMALSIFLDPRKTLRGFHDRAIGSVVVDIKAGRDPMKPRPDDFERQSAEHYLGSPSVPVTAHENLMTTPGAAWAPSQDSASQASGGQGEQPAGQSPFDMQDQQGQQSQQGMYSPAPAPQQDAPITHSPWSPPAAPAPEVPGDQDPGAGAAPAAAPLAQDPSAQDPGPRQPAAPWSSAPSAPSAPPQQGGAPQQGGEQIAWDPQPAPPQQAPHPQAPQPGQQAAGPAAPHPGQEPVPGPQSWAPPAPAEAGASQPPAPGAPAEQSAQVDSSAGQAPQQPSAPDPWAASQPQSQQSFPSAPEGDPSVPAPAPGQAPASVPAGQAAAPAPGAPASGTPDGLDEQTRRTASLEDEDLGDLEATRVSAVSLPQQRRLRVTTDDGTSRVVGARIVVGRNPQTDDGEQAFILRDETRSVSKNHLRIDASGETVQVTDLGSTNGSAVLLPDGTRVPLQARTETELPAGASLALGDRTLIVEREQ